MAGIRMAAVPRDRTSDLPATLRAETADWHDKVEALADISGRVRSRADYVGLLDGWFGLYAGLEAQLSDGAWDRAWLGVGVDIAAHCRAGLLVEDLQELGATPTAPPVQAPFGCFGRALGCLYVLEGSALGGRVVAGMVRSAIGAAPTAFLSGRARAHQWPAVRSALRRFDAQGGDTAAVVAGASSTFALFAQQFVGPGWQR